MTPEGRIKAKFNRGLKAIQEKYPELWVRMPVPRGMGGTWLDYHMCLAGFTYVVEAKRDSKHDLTPQQKATKRDLERAGAVVDIIYDNKTIDFALYRVEQRLWHAYGDRIKAQ